MKLKHFGGLLQSYQDFYNGTKMHFDLCDCGEPSIDIKNFNARSRTSFLPTISFLEDGDEKPKKAKEEKENII
jgi:hypothetical protein